MKRILFLFFLFANIAGFSQTVVGDRLIGRQAIYLRNRYLDSVLNTYPVTYDLRQRTNAFLTARASYHLSHNMDSAKAKGFYTQNLFADTVTESEYEIIVFPDLQNMVAVGSPASRFDAGRSMFQWVKDSADDYNVKAIIGVGDMSEEGNNDAEWDTLNAWYGRLDAINMPYMTPPGNHDYNNRFTMFATGRDLTKYNTHFGTGRYSSKPFFVDAFHGRTENSLYKFDAGSRKYAVLVLEFFPTDSALAWASAKCDSLLAADPLRQVIVTTHAYMRAQGERSRDDSPSSVNAYPAGSGGVGADNSGEELFNKFIRKKKNIRFVFSGHFIINGIHIATGLTKRIVSVGDNGNIIDEIYVNYQDASDYGNGYMVRMRVNPNTGRIDVKFWSAYEATFDPLYPQYTISDPTLKVQTSVGITGDLTVNSQLRVSGTPKFEKLTRGRIPFVTYDGELRDTSDLRYSIDTARLLIGNPVDNNLSKIQFTGGMKGTGKIFFSDSLQVLADAVVGNNPIWFKTKHPGNAVNPGISVNSLFRLETVDLNVSPMWYNLFRLRMHASVALGSYLSQEIGYSTAAYNNSYQRFKYVGPGSTDNFYEIFTYGSGGVFDGSTKFYVDGNVQIGAPEVSTKLTNAILDIQSTTKGLVIPRMTAAQRNAIGSPVASMVVYDTDSSRYMIHNGSIWKGVAYTSEAGGGGGSAGWALTGNALTAGASTGDFIGSTNNTSMRFRTNNTEKMVLDSNGRLGIGTLAPTQKLHVHAGVIRASGTGGANSGELNLDNGSEFTGFQFRQESATLWAAKSVSAGADLSFYVDNTSTNGVYIKTGGNVGIGTASPGSYRLNVAGAIRTNNRLVLADVSTPSTPPSGEGDVYNNSDKLRFINDNAEVFTLEQLASGTRTPTATNGTNVSSSTTNEEHYIRVGSVVHVYGTISIDCASAAVTSVIDLDLPIASAFTTVTDLSGILFGAESGTTSPSHGSGSAEITNDRVTFTFTPRVDTGTPYRYSYSYQVL
jgi:hypothetical protein